ncbi:MAG: M48 family metalloprotease [Prochlorothrix sp.]|nr:M48 family metalloprotease [Prochlorothrix sp.]
MNQIKTVALLGLLSGLLVSLSYSLGGSSGALLGVGFAAVMNLGSWFYSDKIALAAYHAQPLSAQDAPQIHSMVAKLADRGQMPMPQIYLVPSNAANAFATGRDPEHAAVAVTQGIINLLPPEELEAVIAHELSHIYNRDTLTQAVAATVAGAISWLAQMAFWFMGSSRDDDGPNPLVALVGVIVAPVAATVIQLGLSRTREFAADAGAARLTGNPRALANALQRLEAGSQQLPLDANPAFAPLLIINVPSRKMLARFFSTHPSTADRVQRLLELES